MKRVMKKISAVFLALIVFVSGIPSMSQTAEASSEIGVPTNISVEAGKYESIVYYFTGTQCQNIEFRKSTDSMDENLIIHSRPLQSGSDYAYYSVEYFGLTPDTNVSIQPYDTVTNTVWDFYTVSVKAPEINIDACNGQEMEFSFNLFSKDIAENDVVDIGYTDASEPVYQGNGLSYSIEEGGGWNDQTDPTNKDKVVWQYKYNCKLTLYTNGTYGGIIFSYPESGSPKPVCKLKFNIHNHIEGKGIRENIIESTCGQEGGYDLVVYCSNCGMKISSNKIITEATGLHEWNEEYTIDKNPTCMEQGSKSHHCTRCNAQTEAVEIPALGHDWNEVRVIKAATCSEDGTKLFECTRRDEIKTEPIPALGHRWNTEATIDKVATCTEDGSKSIHCITCGAIEPGSEQVIPKTGHKFGEWTTVKSPNCIDQGSDQRECSICGYIETRNVDPTGHTWNTELTMDKEPTCIEEGSKSIHCQKCDAVKDSVAIPALGHSKHREKTSDNKVVDKCSVCGEVLSSIALPYAPKTVLAKLYGYDDIKFSWTSAAGASGYYVYYKKSTSANYTYAGSTTGTTYKKADLTDGAKYYFKVVPYKTIDGTKYKSLKYKTAYTYTLKRVSTPSVYRYSSSRVKVKWSNILGESGYQISKSTSKTGTNIVYTYSTTKGTYKTISAKKGKTYYYKVRAYRAVDGKRIYGPWSYVKAYKLR